MITVGIDLDGVIRHNNKSMGTGDIPIEQRNRMELLRLYEEGKLPRYYYITEPRDVHFIEGALAALRMLHKLEIPCYVFTNQEAIGIGVMTHRQWLNIKELMSQHIDYRGGHITDWFYCPHFPDENCTCRKPKSGMFFEARDKHGVDLSEMYMIGDNPSDMQAGKAAVCKCNIHIRLEAADPEFQSCPADATVGNLHAAVIEIMKREGLFIEDLALRRGIDIRAMHEEYKRLYDKELEGLKKKN